MSEETFELDPWECWESGKEACVFLSAFQTANILLHFRTVAVLGTHVKYVAVEILCLSYRCLYCERFFFTSVPTVVCVRELCSCLCIQWPERDKGWEWWEIASGEKSLSKTTFLWVLGSYFSVGEQLVTEVTQARVRSWKSLVQFEIQTVILRISIKP